MLKINNRKPEAQVKEIQQQAPYAFADEYLMARNTRYLEAVKRGNKLQ
ncbi:hypothetical protein PMIT1306_02447 [Prochlorococcus sp. MIT 1306]|nr:hypothetical protein PMIT1306_02447 [Prochlorococcus sp. MIT 1306]